MRPNWHGRISGERGHYPRVGIGSKGIERLQEYSFISGFELKAQEPQPRFELGTC